MFHCRHVFVDELIISVVNMRAVANDELIQVGQALSVPSIVDPVAPESRVDFLDAIPERFVNVLPICFEPPEAFGRPFVGTSAGSQR